MNEHTTLMQNMKCLKCGLILLEPTPTECMNHHLKHQKKKLIKEAKA